MVAWMQLQDGSATVQYLLLGTTYTLTQYLELGAFAKMPYML